MLGRYFAPHCFRARFLPQNFHPCPSPLLPSRIHPIILAHLRCQWDRQRHCLGAFLMFIITEMYGHCLNVAPPRDENTSVRNEDGSKSQIGLEQPVEVSFSPRRTCVRRLKRSGQVPPSGGSRRRTTGTGSWTAPDLLLQRLALPLLPRPILPQRTPCSKSLLLRCSNFAAGTAVQDVGRLGGGRSSTFFANILYICTYIIVSIQMLFFSL
jgi:hypothetical protein